MATPPNDHNVNYFNQLKDLVLDIQTDNPTYSIIIMGDFNITLEARDGININTSLEEINGDRLSKNDEKLPYLRKIAKRFFLYGTVSINVKKEISVQKILKVRG